MSSTTSIADKGVVRRTRSVNKLIARGHLTVDQLHESERRLEAYVAYTELYDEFERFLANEWLQKQAAWDRNGVRHRIARTHWYQLTAPKRDLLELGYVPVAFNEDDDMPLIHFIEGYTLYFDDMGELLVYPELIARDEYGTGAKIIPLIDVAKSGTADHFRMILAFLQNLPPFA